MERVESHVAYKRDVSQVIIQQTTNLIDISFLMIGVISVIYIYIYIYIYIIIKLVGKDNYQAYNLYLIL